MAKSTQGLGLDSNTEIRKAKDSKEEKRYGRKGTAETRRGETVSIARKALLSSDGASQCGQRKELAVLQR